MRDHLSINENMYFIFEKEKRVKLSMLYIFDVKKRQFITAVAIHIIILADSMQFNSEESTLLKGTRVAAAHCYGRYIVK